MAERGLPAPSVAVKKIQEVLTQLKPYFQKAADVYNSVEPYVEKGCALAEVGWAKLQPYHPEEFVPMLVGLVMIFYGGTFMTLIACVEAYRMFGWADTQSSLRLLISNYQRAVEANRKDDAVDSDRDGVADTQQMSTQDLATRKLKLLLKSTDPQQLDQAVCGIVNGFMAVVASLRLKFAKAIALGSSIADIIDTTFEHALAPALRQLIPPDYEKWAPMVRRYVARSIGVTIAWWLYRLIAALHSALRGADLVVTGALGYAVRHGYAPAHSLKDRDQYFQVAGGGIALLGIYLQITGGFSPRFPFNLLLLPARVAETFLQYFVGVAE
eukprot:CAMPEP_0177788182 /NCGR_PEP_ID=MMETSP0491_2-20121128/21953_1 /TAXON_ID=63592 /ORGANISM="Tetraselmis chuii, Strain PLY429" /LENGTH=326 /DNA_ID=CAMNT_0019309709 /DNA_START=205 /DNA_END=1185 /DNA_ORIENTATION=+